MNIVVCVKLVPDTAEADVAVNKAGTDIVTDDLVYDLNEWDSYAIEEAVLLKEQLGGTVTAITLGPEESDEALRKCLAIGADEAVHLLDEAFAGSDSYATAKALASAIKSLPCDLIFTGAQASDDGSAQVGATIATLLGLPHATLVTKEVLGEGKIRAHRELEGGLEEVVELSLPAVLTIQSGINEPRYVSIAGIRKVARKEIRLLEASDLGLGSDQVGEAGSRTLVTRLFTPPLGQKGEILQGRPEAAATQLARILKEKGWLG